MRLKNNGLSKHDFTYDVPDKLGNKKMTLFSIMPGEEFELKKDHPLYKQMSQLPKAYPKDWLEVSPPKLSKEELEAQMAELKAEEKAAADAKKKEEDDAKKAKADAK